MCVAGRVTQAYERSERETEMKNKKKENNKKKGKEKKKTIKRINVVRYVYPDGCTLRGPECWETCLSWQQLGK